MSVAATGHSAVTPHQPTARRTVPWERIGLAILLAATAASFLVGLDRNGWANPYYSAAAQAGAQDWAAFFYGSLDAGNLITVDKPPLSIWIMSLSVRLFGLNSWAILVPQALMGVATTWLIYKIIRLSHPAPPALLGGLIYATTPVVVLMSRYNNPEPLMGLLTVAAVYFIIRAIQDNSWSWYLLGGSALGLGFMAKQIQAFLPVPALLLAVLLFGAGTLVSRFLRVLGSLAALVINGGWWMTIVELTPAANRPFIGGSTGNSAVQLAAGYNGLARFMQFTNQNGAAASLEDQSLVDIFRAGITRLFNADFAPESAWFLFPALCCAAIILFLGKLLSGQQSAPAAAIGSIWLLTAFVTLCFAGTMVHSYYTFSFAAPASITLVLGVQQLWRERQRPITRLIGSVVIASTGYIGSRIVDYSDFWPSFLGPMILTSGLFAALLWAFLYRIKLVLALVTIAFFLGPIVTNMVTINSEQHGTNPLSGPGSTLDGSLAHKFEVARAGEDPRTLQIAFGSPPDAQMVRALRNAVPEARWAAVTITAQNAALYQLESRRPVAALGGWLGLDPVPSLEHFKELVAEGHIGFYIDQPLLLAEQQVGKETGAIIEWIRGSFLQSSVGAEVVYDLKQRKA